MGTARSSSWLRYAAFFQDMGSYFGQACMDPDLYVAQICQFTKVRTGSQVLLFIFATHALLSMDSKQDASFHRHMSLVDVFLTKSIRNMREGIAIMCEENYEAAVVPACPLMAKYCSTSTDANLLVSQINFKFECTALEVAIKPSKERHEKTPQLDENGFDNAVELDANAATSTDQYVATEQSLGPCKVKASQELNIQHQHDATSHASVVPSEDVPYFIKHDFVRSASAYHPPAV